LGGHAGPVFDAELIQISDVNKVSSFMFNFMMGLAFFVCLGVLLYIRYKGKPTPEEVDAKNRQKQEYILSKLKMVNATHYAQSKGIPMDCRTHPAGNGMGTLTNLPAWKGPEEDYYTRKYA
jgi:hypothetical protein